MSAEDNIFYVVINGMDLTGKTTLANNLQKACKEEVEVLRSSFSVGNPLNILANKIRNEREAGVYSRETLEELYKFARTQDLVLYELLARQYPVISDEAIGHIYADVTARELELFKPSKSIIHDSSTIIKTLTIHTDLGSSPELMSKLEALRLKHPTPTKSEHSILLEASIEAKIDRLNKRIREAVFVSELDQKIFTDPGKVARQAAIMKEITLHTFPGTLVFDTTNMTEQEVFDAVRNHLEICKPKGIK